MTSKTKILLASCLLVFFSAVGLAQKPKDGKYTYTVMFAEWGKSMGCSCTVIIKGDHIKVIHNGSCRLSLTKTGNVLDEGIIIRHKSGKWIIGHSLKDKNAKEVGGCSDGPEVIDFKRKIFWVC